MTKEDLKKGDVLVIPVWNMLCGTFAASREKDMATSIRIREISNTNVGPFFYFDILNAEGVKVNSCSGCFEFDDLIASQPMKKKAAAHKKFALQYELDQGPTEYFATLAQVKARLKELSLKHSLKRDRIYLHTLAKTQKVELGVSIAIRKV